MRDMSPAVRIYNNGTVGSAIHVYGDGRTSYWLTNAHVAGTKIGNTVRIERHDTETTRTDARVIAAAYRRGTSVDLAVLESDFVNIPTTPIVTNPRNTKHAKVSGGSPRAEPTSWKFRYPNRANGQLRYFTPEAIGGESGSGIVDPQIDAIVGLVTWRTQGYTLAQSSELVASVLREEIAEPQQLPNDAIPACDQPAYCVDGYHGSVATLPEGMFFELPKEPDGTNNCTGEPTKPERTTEPEKQQIAPEFRLRDPSRPTDEPVSINWRSVVEFVILAMELLQRLDLDLLDQLLESLPASERIELEEKLRRFD